MLLVYTARYKYDIGNEKRSFHPLCRIFIKYERVWLFSADSFKERGIVLC